MEVNGHLHAWAVLPRERATHTPRKSFYWTKGQIVNLDVFTTTYGGTYKRYVTLSSRCVPCSQFCLFSRYNWAFWGYRYSHTTAITKWGVSDLSLQEPVRPAVAFLLVYLLPVVCGAASELAVWNWLEGKSNNWLCISENSVTVLAEERVVLQL
jgi:hypothetical protein